MGTTIFKDYKPKLDKTTNTLVRLSISRSAFYQEVSRLQNIFNGKKLSDIQFVVVKNRLHNLMKIDINMYMELKLSEQFDRFLEVQFSLNEGE